MQKIRTLLGVVATLAAVSACSNPPVSPGVDAAMNDTGAAMGDSGADAGSTTDSGPVAGSCGAPIDLMTMGTALTTGTGRTIHTSNATAPAAAMAGLLDGSCSQSNATNEMVFRYTVQMGGHIQASTDDPATDAMLDTIVWIMDACTDAANELACDDDVDYANMNFLSRASSPSVVSAGTTVYIVVGGYMGSTGAFTLNVSELPSHAAGDACDGTNPFCVDGFSCQPDAAGTTAGHCLADGVEYGACRVTGTACDGTLVCSVMAPTADANGTCQMPIAGTDPCTTRHSVCVTGFSCQLDDGSTTDGHCLADGSEYGLCRPATPYCDGTLMCGSAMPMAGDGSTCQMPIATGGACTPRHYLCVANNTCIPDAGSMTMGHCIADGAMGGACRPAAPACDGTLTCGADGLCN